MGPIWCLEPRGIPQRGSRGFNPAFCYLRFLEESLGGSAWRGHGGHSDMDRKGTRRDDRMVGGETEPGHPSKACSPRAPASPPHRPSPHHGWQLPGPQEATGWAGGRWPSLPRYACLSVILKQLRPETLSLNRGLRKEFDESRLWEKTDVKPSDPRQER